MSDLSQLVRTVILVIIVTRIVQALLIVCEGGEGRRAGFVWTNFCVGVLRPGSLRKPDGDGFPGGIEWDGQTCGIHTPRLVGLASLSVQQVNRSPSQLKNTPGLGSNPGF